MSDNLSDVNAAARLREMVRAIVRDTLAHERPPDVFATVVGNQTTVSVDGLLAALGQN